ncbi:UrcA family protein [Sphingomonas sp. R-74633]|uniref:UrcA family protein n=1 Tax=Sphingomonas sp. R-74633 TaxID=2751188 RepID=UPI0015D23D22|nr:UrcA family protein [Sphingomonas sp. R-74633]NYT41188.1 UrcA family protein [Sphingomonas sp. R-74633]
MTKFIAAFAAATLIATPALAEERTVFVSHTDLDLKTDAGRNALNRRLAAATEQVCGSYSNVAADELDTVKSCRAKVQRDVARQLQVQFARR